MKQKLEDGDTDTALLLAEKAFAIKPKHVETQDTLLRLQAEKSDWKGARETLTANLKTGQLPRNVHKRRDAVLALSEAKGIFAEGQTPEAQDAAIEANRMSPDLVPAAVMAAETYIDQNNTRAATRVIKKAWDVTPHSDLAATFAAIVPDEDPKARIKRFRGLTKSHPAHPETKMLLAELNIAAEDFPEHIHAAWEPVCVNCSGFDTLSWREPPKGEVAMPSGVEMLPLIVGQIEAPKASDADIVESEIVEDLEDADAPK